MRYQKLLPGLAAISLLVLMVVVFTATRSGSLPAAQRFERLGLQGEGVEREARGPLVPVEAQRDPIVVLPAAFGTIDSLKDVPAVPFIASAALSRSEEPELPRANPSGVSGPDAVAQTWAGKIDMPSPIANFDGISLADQGASFSPPDTNGDIGYDPATGKRYYFQWINVAYKAWDVTNPASPVVVVPLTSGNALWQAALPGTPCANNNDGDPIVLFDEQAQRWFISQFSVSNPFHQCVAVSQTANPAGAWYVYDYPYRDGVTFFNDYPHFGVWPDTTYNAYYMTMHEFNAAGTAYLGQSASAFDRARLLNGDSTAPLVTFALGTSFGGMLPADLDGPPPTSGTPGFFFMTTPGGTLQIWEFKPDWVTPANSIFGVGAGHTANTSLAITAYTDACTVSTCSRVPQSGTANLLDSLGDRLMHRVAFRSLDGSTQTAVLNHTVDVDGAAGSDRTGVRWYEARRNPASGVWSINQQSTYAPGTTDYRWMGSIATDRAGNIALGYSASSSSIFPAIRYAGRLFTDTLSQLPQAEVTMTLSTGAQTGSDRWGDYSMMGVDPQDGCTFWYTQEYNGTTASLPWKTRIGSFKFAECTPVATGSLSGTVRNAGNSNPINGAAVVAMDSLGATAAATTDVSGIYRIIGLPIGPYTVTASAGVYNPGTATGVSVSVGVTTTQNFTLTALPQADLSLIKTASASTLAPGSSLAYTLTVTNNGPDAIGTTVTVTDVLPSGYVLGTATGAGWSCSGTTTIVCTRTGLGVSTSASVNINGTAPAAVGPIVNTATTGASVFDPSPANNSATVTVTLIPQTDLAITKSGPATAAPGATLVYNLNVTNNGPMTVGTFTATYTNSAAIAIPDNSAQLVTSTIDVIGLPPVQLAQASLRGVTHTWPEDIDALLVAPGGQKTFLMSDPRGGANPVSNIDLQFDDTAAAILCTSGVLAVGTYHPTDCPNDFGTDTFASPAPAGPYTATLSVFNTANPNGTWKLFARDDSAGDSGGFNSGWTLTLVGSYSLTVTDTLPIGTAFVGATGNGWSCTEAGGVVTCARTTLAPGAAPTIVITATAPLAT
ncbi:MAG TPA: carboxypeptidase regulatory-like domain-containing protein, partial [Anaerolineae bacterium]|nr:carboxypeptidase regulatory-like domain-containing protein [Anaerolineae bacterium]